MGRPSPRRHLNLMRAAIVAAIGAQHVDAQMAGLRTERLADGVYAIVRTTRPQDPSDANTLVIINEADVVVVDGNITPQSTRAVIREIRQLTSKPVRYVIITHAHSDHHTGNIEYRRAWPEVEFVAHENTYREIRDDDVVSFRRNVSKVYPEEITRLRGVLARGTRADGSALPPAERAQAQSTIDAMEYFIAEASTFEPIPPTLTFGDSLVLHRGTRLIVLRHLGHGNTRGDVVVHLPNEGVLATGDLVVSPIPFAFGSFPLAWASTLDRLRALPATIIMPGHGEPMRDWAYVDELRALMCATVREGIAAAAATTPVDSVVSRLSLGAHVEHFAAGDSIRARAMRGTFIRPAIEGLRGELRAAPGAAVPPSCVGR